MPNETFEEHCINIILPKPCHPKLTTVPAKHETQYLATTTHLLLRKRMFNTRVSQAAIAHKFRVKNKKLHMAISGKKYDPGKKPSCKKGTPVKQKAMQKKSTADQPTSPEAEITKIHGDNEQAKQDTDDDLLYGSDDSLPDLFTLQNPKKVKTSNTKDQAEDTGTNMPAAMDTEMPELILDDKQPSQKQFTFKNPPSQKPPHK